MYRYLLAGALLALAACSQGDSPLAPATDPDGRAELAQDGPLLGRILFSSYRNGGQADLYVMNADGTGQTRLTFTPEDEHLPAWSYDNQRIAFMRKRADGSNVLHQDIYVMDANGANGHWVSPTPNPVDLLDPEWSPDGSRIAVSAGQSLAWLDVATGALNYVKNGQGAAFNGITPSFDATGQKILFGSGQMVALRNVDGTGSAFTIAGPSNTRARYPTFSPDGQKIAFAAHDLDKAEAEIYVVGADGSGLTRLGSSPAEDTKPSWSPDGKQIAFTSNRGGQYQIYRMNVSGGRRTRLGIRGVTEVNPAYS
ncbi:MAG TPA: hypothetical protein VGJ36_07695, partial [Gemmatimonadales bacterium]